MGYMRHHAIVVTGIEWNHSPRAVVNIHAAHKRAQEIFSEEVPAYYANLSMLVSPLIEGATNGYFSFFIAPDGSKMGWDLQKIAGECRGKFVDWLKTATDENGDTGLLDWVLIQYGDDDGKTLLLDYPARR